MKKIVSLFLALALVFSLTISASAAISSANIDNNSDPKETSEVVKVNVVAPVSSDEIYYVVVKWDSMDFTYKFANQGTWNPQTHAYDSAKESGWYNGETKLDGNPDPVNIKVYNHSNVALNTTVKIDGSNSATVVSGVDATLSGNEFTLGSAVEKGLEEATVAANIVNAGDATYTPSGIATLTITGAPTEGTAANIYKKTITVAVSKYVAP